MSKTLLRQEHVVHRPAQLVGQDAQRLARAVARCQPLE